MLERTSIGQTIPQKIHYCWFGSKPLPQSAEKCIESWKRFLPDYEIIRWDENNFDVNIIPYTSQAYKVGRFAFVSDYARFWILYNYGGIYFDTDVEVIKNMDNIIDSGPFLGCENPYTPEAPLTAPGTKLGVNPGLGLGVFPGIELYKEFLDLYASLRFIRKDGSHDTTTIVTYVTKILCEKGLLNSPDIQQVSGVKIYPVDYFCPLDYKTGTLHITDNTVSIHHYTASWRTKTDDFKSLIARFLGQKIMNVLLKVRRKLY